MGAPLVNLCFDMLGTYTPILLMCAGIMLAVTLVMQAVISRAHGVKKEVEEALLRRLEQEQTPRA